MKVFSGVEQSFSRFANIKAFALDFDGTLADTVKTHNAARLEAFKRMAEQTGDPRFSAIPDEVHAEAHNRGSHPKAIIGWILMQAELADSISDPVVEHTVALKKDIYKELAAGGLDEIPGATKFARALARAIPGKNAIVTTAHRDTEVIPFLKRYELMDHFDDQLLVTYEDVTEQTLKPHPAAYIKALAKLGMQDRPRDIASLEDTPRGIASAKQAGLTTIAIATTHKRVDLEALTGDDQPDIIVDNFEQLQAMWDAR